MISILDAIDAFVTSFAYQRSRTFPYLVERHGNLIVTRDAPERTKDRRVCEIMVLPGADADAVQDQVKALDIKDRIAVCVMTNLSVKPSETASEYKPLGYRLLRSEPLMAYDLAKPARETAPHKIVKVETIEQGKTLKAKTSCKWVADDLVPFGDDRDRVYYCDVGGVPVARCRSIITHPTASYVGGMYTAEPYRRKGIGTSLLAAMTNDDGASGLKYSVLLATTAGFKLYTNFGYEQLGWLVLFKPKN